MNEMGRGIENVPDCVRGKNLPCVGIVHSWCLVRGSWMPSQCTHTLSASSFLWDSSPLFILLARGYGSNDPGLAGHSSPLHTYDPMKPKHTLKELLYSRPSTSGRRFDFKVYLHIYYSTSKSRVVFFFFFKGYSNICLPLMETIPLAYVPYAVELLNLTEIFSILKV